MLKWRRRAALVIVVGDIMLESNRRWIFWPQIFARCCELLRVSLIDYHGDMSFSPYKGSRDFISVSMPWKADKDDHNSKSRRHTSIYRVNKPAVMIMVLLWWRSFENVFCVCLYLGNFVTNSLVADNRQQHVLKYPSSQIRKVDFKCYNHVSLIFRWLFIH